MCAVLGLLVPCVPDAPPSAAACGCCWAQVGLPIYAKQGGGDAAADEDDEKVRPAAAAAAATPC